MKRCALYRHYDDRGVLLYVGITDRLTRRGSDHARSSEWAQFAVRAEAEWFAARQIALTAEKVAIENEQPVYNKANARGNQHQRVEKYLSERDRRPKVEGAHEVFVTLREVAGSFRIKYDFATLRRAARTGAAGFPEPAGRTGLRDGCQRYYSRDELEEWAQLNLAFDPSGRSVMAPPDRRLLRRVARTRTVKS